MCRERRWKLRNPVRRTKGRGGRETCRLGRNMDGRTFLGGANPSGDDEWLKLVYVK